VLIIIKQTYNSNWKVGTQNFNEISDNVCVQFRIAKLSAKYVPPPWHKAISPEIWANASYLRKFIIFEQMHHIWANASYVSKCIIFEQMPNASYFIKCIIFEQMHHIWANALYLSKCIIFEQMHHIWGNASYLSKCIIFEQLHHIWGNASYLSTCIICDTTFAAFSPCTLSTVFCKVE
jgi:hypothetical protein